LSVAKPQCAASPGDTNGITATCPA
jgi:hypothetical protein